MPKPSPPPSPPFRFALHLLSLAIATMLMFPVTSRSDDGPVAESKLPATKLLLNQSNNARQSSTNDSKGAKNSKKPAAPFRWVNPPKQNELPRLSHHTFRSPSMNIDVGYCLHLPDGYNDSGNRDRRYPVVYYLHGGRPGSESKSVALVRSIHRLTSDNDIDPAIYVFVNGGPVSHYNYPGIDNGRGEDVFVQELIPHIDRTWRTIADRSGRALEGFSQGGRGTARIMFKHPQLFCSAAAGGGGYATEKRISEDRGRESESLVFIEGDNTWDLARSFARHPDPKLRILIFVGNKGFNYENNLEYMRFLESLKIPFERLIVPDAPHSAQVIYDERGFEILSFHSDNFRRSQSAVVQP